MIQIINLNKSYANTQVLHDINEQYDEGKIYGIVGQNGAGKTTFFKCIAGIEKYQGQIYAANMPLKNYLGFLPTEPYFMDHITGREYIQFLCNARKKPLIDIDSQNIFDLPLDKYVTTYSTGMKKKLGLFAILLQENKYFILDEPFNGVDIHSNILIAELLSVLKTKGKIILISSHILVTLTTICDVIQVLSQGKIIKSAFPDEFSILENELKALFIGDKIKK